MSGPLSPAASYAPANAAPAREALRRGRRHSGPPGARRTPPVVLLRRRRHRLLAALASQALANAIALLDSARPRDAAQRLALASRTASRCLWDALLRRACARGGDPRHALELLSAAIEDHGMVMSLSTYRMMVVLLSAHGKVDCALRVFDVMTRRGCQVEDRICSSIISEFSRTGKAGAGLDFYEKVKHQFSGFDPGLVTLTSVVHALGMEGRTGEMAELMREMECKGMNADAVFYGSMVHGYMSRGFLMGGLREHRSMLERGITAVVVSYTTVIDGLCREGSVEKVMGFLDEMERVDAKPNLITYTSLVGGFCKRDRLEDAFSIVRKLKQTGVVVDEYVYSILIDSLCKMEDLDRAFLMLTEMDRNQHCHAAAKAVGQETTPDARKQLVMETEVQVPPPPPEYKSPREIKRAKRTEEKIATNVKDINGAGSLEERHHPQ